MYNVFFPLHCIIDDFFHIVIIVCCNIP